jgi:DNA-binding beta-propeller fold protein YncE
MRPYLDRYGPGQRYPHRWWFPEDYKSAAEWIRAVTPSDQRDRLILDPAGPPGLREALAATLQPSALGRLWRYFLYRETLNPLGSEDGIFYVARDISGPGPLAGANSPSNLSVVSSFGQPGSNPSEFNAPRAIAVGPDGSVYVADSLNHRVQKFDSAGRFLAQVGGQGTGPGQFQEPWGVAVGPDGSVYVADTWNHRVQKFDPNLRFIAAWGGFAAAGPDSQAEPSRFYGPRDVAVDASGRVFVADTGNKRIQVFGPDGQFLLALGGPGSEPGRFNEPVGLKFDGAGRLWVADTWNRRVQVFDAELQPIAQIAVPGWNGTGIQNKPYLAAGPDGSVWATDPEGGRLLRFNPGFRLAGSFTGPFALPAGAAFDAAGQLLVTDGSASRVFRLRQPGS